MITSEFFPVVVLRAEDGIVLFAMEAVQEYRFRNNSLRYESLDQMVIPDYVGIQGIGMFQLEEGRFSRFDALPKNVVRLIPGGAAFAEKMPAYDAPCDWAKRRHQEFAMHLLTSTEPER